MRHSLASTPAPLIAIPPGIQLSSKFFLPCPALPLPPAPAPCPCPCHTQPCTAHPSLRSFDLIIFIGGGPAIRGPQRRRVTPRLDCPSVCPSVFSWNRSVQRASALHIGLAAGCNRRYGVALLNDSKHGYSCHGNMMALVLPQLPLLPNRVRGLCRGGGC